MGWCYIRHLNGFRHAMARSVETEPSHVYESWVAMPIMSSIIAFTSESRRVSMEQTSNLIALSWIMQSTSGENHTKMQLGRRMSSDWAFGIAWEAMVIALNFSQYCSIIWSVHTDSESLPLEAALTFRLQTIQTLCSRDTKFGRMGGVSSITRRIPGFPKRLAKMTWFERLPSTNISATIRLVERRFTAFGFNAAMCLSMCSWSLCTTEMSLKTRRREVERSLKLTVDTVDYFVWIMPLVATRTFPNPVGAEAAWWSSHDTSPHGAGTWPFGKHKFGLEIDYAHPLKRTIGWWRPRGPIWGRAWHGC